MRIIFLNLSMFSANHRVQVLDESGELFSGFIEEHDIPHAIGALAQEYGTNQIRIIGNENYALAYIDEIISDYSLKYGKNNLNVEVL